MIQMWALRGIPEIKEGTDLSALILEAAGATLRDGDILVVTSKIVSKAEGRIVHATDREAAIESETVRVVASRSTPSGTVRIVENRLGIVGAAAGVDASNTVDGTVLLLPVDPDESARRIMTAIRSRGIRVGVIISDTLGRPWREGQVDVAVGAAGVQVLLDLRGGMDAGGRPLTVSMPCVADELAAATDLVKGKADRLPVAVVRGLSQLVGEPDLPGASTIHRPAELDMFRSGSDEAEASGYARGYEEGLRRALHVRSRYASARQWWATPRAHSDKN